MTVVTKEVRFSYVSVFEKSVKTDSDGKQSEGPYSVVLLIPKTDTETIKAIENAIDACVSANKASKFGGKVAGLQRPLRDGDAEKDAEEYQGMMFMTANSYNSKPKVLREDKTEIVSSTPEQLAQAKEEFYSGCYGRASFEFYPYNKGKKGIACGLRALMKTRDGESLSGAVVDPYADFGIDKPVDEFD